VYHRVHPKWFLSLWFIWRKPCTYLATILALSPNGLKRDSLWPTSPRSSIECIKNNLWAYSTFGANHAPILRQDYHYLQIDRIELPLEPPNLGVPSGASKTICEPMVCLAQTVHLSCTNANTITKRTEMRFHMTHVTLEFYRVCPKRFLIMWYVQHKLCTYLASRLALSPNGPKWASIWASSKMVSKPMFHLAQTVHLSSTNTNTFSKRIEMRFHLTHVT
jgi:hypothetical protein